MKLDFLKNQEWAIPQIAEWYFNDQGKNILGNSVEKTIERIVGKLDTSTPPFHVIAHENGKVLGVAQLKLHELDQFPDYKYWLGSVYVSPKTRGQGIAREICLEVCKIASESFSATELYLSTENLTGGLYADIGFEALSQIVDRGDDVLIMRKHLRNRINV